MKRYCYYILGLILSSFGGCIMIKMSLGQSTFNAFSYGLYLLTGIKVGYISIIYNIIIIFIEIMILNKDFKKIQLLQILPGLISGFVLNYFVYDFVLTAHLAIDNYIFSLVIFIIGLVINALGISLVVNAKLIGLPTETLCLELEKKTNKDFKIIRTLFDVIYVIIALMITLILKDVVLIREGTVINLVFMGSLIGFFNKICIKYIYHDK